MNDQLVPGVKDVKRPSITATTYAVYIGLAMVAAAAGALVVAHLPADETVDTVTFDLASSGATSCTYDAATRQTTIRTHLDATTRQIVPVVLTAGVRNTDTERAVASTRKTLHLRGDHQADYTFVVHVSRAAHAHGATACFVESATGS